MAETDLSAGRVGGRVGGRTALRVLPTPPRALARGMSVGEVLRATTLDGARLLAGERGLDRTVERLNVMEVPDILPWVKPHELLLTTGYPLRQDPGALHGLVAELDRRGLAALAIKPGRYLDDVPRDVLAQADRLGFPLIRLPDEVAFDDILNQVLTAILDRQATVLARSEECHRALVQIVLDGGGLRELAGEVARQLGAAVRIEDGTGRTLVATDEPGPDGRLDGARMVSVAVAAAGVQHGRIIACLHGREPDAGDVNVLERAATVAALVVTRQLAVSAVESKYQADFLRDVLEGRVEQRSCPVMHAAELGWDLARPVVVTVAEVDPRPEVRVSERDERLTRERFAGVWARVVRNRDPKAAVAALSQEVVAVVGAPVGTDPAELVRKAYGSTTCGLPGNPSRRLFSVGVSRVVDDPTQLPAAYAQATRALRIGRRIHGGGAVVRFDDLGVYRLLSLVGDTGELRSFVADTLGPLADRDDAEATDLRRTLDVLLETNLNVAETARRLHFHYNTLRYRISKLECLLGPFTTDATLRLDVLLALRVLAMSGV